MIDLLMGVLNKLIMLRVLKTIEHINVMLQEMYILLKKCFYTPLIFLLWESMKMQVKNLVFNQLLNYMIKLKNNHIKF